MGSAARFNASLRTVACGLIASTVWGCSSWQATPLTEPAPGASGPRSHELRIRKPDGKEVTLVNWTLEGDTLRGSHEEWVKHARVRTDEVIALSEVRLPDSDLQGDSLRKALEAGPVLPERIRLRLLDGTTIELEHAAVDGDSLRGLVTPTTGANQPGQYVAIARKDVRTVEVRHHNSGSTAALILAGTLVVCGVVFGLAFASEMANGN